MMHNSEETEALEIQAAQWLAEAEGSGRQAMEEGPGQLRMHLLQHAAVCSQISQAYSMLIIARKPVQR